MIAFFVWIIVTTPKKNASDVEWSFSSSLSISSDGTMSEADVSDALKASEEKEAFYEELEWYDTLEEAMRNDSRIKTEIDNIYYLCNYEFFRIELEGKLAIFYTVPDEDNRKDELMLYMLFGCQEGKISQPYYMDGMLPVPGWGSNDCFYDCDDGVVDYIVYQMIRGKYQQEPGLEMFYGAWPDKEELESLTIAGIPLNVLQTPIQVGGNDNYFWYITDLSWTERLSSLNWSGITWGQIIEALDIQYKPTQTEKDKE